MHKAQAFLLGYMSKQAEEKYPVESKAKPLIPGNIDIYNRPQVPNPKGGSSTVYSAGFGMPDGRTMLLPTVSDEATIMSPRDAYKYWQNKKQHLGIFNTQQDADTYGEALHLQQAKQYKPPFMQSILPPQGYLVDKALHTVKRKQ
jgi:hypothetical protein